MSSTDLRVQDSRSPGADRSAHASPAMVPSRQSAEDAFWASLPATLTTASLARTLRINEDTTLRRLAEGRIPGYRLTSSSWLVFRDELRAHLNACSNRLPRHTAAPDVLAEYADVLGYRDLMLLLGKSKPTIYAWLQAGTIPGYFLDGRWLVYRHELRAALDEVRNGPRVSA
ncbi:helix-turn-helix domain-containing protein [Agromyces silvae]|uniref:helix-turn-helix domain-containing protein n=1 Tax=Agromyces silvae TaxID=3388266 RepID=UPI00280B9CF7|nr:helix-turn-helix domain-containing protein [Agromyces protaetiae]